MSDFHLIHEVLLPLATPISLLIPDAENARFHSQGNIDAIKASLERFGQDQPLVVQRSNNVVRKGNGRLQAAKELGWTHLAAVFVDEDNIDAAARAIADNRSAELAKWDNRVLSLLLTKIKLERPDFAPQSLGFTQEQVERLKSKTAPARAAESFPETPLITTGSVRVVQLYLTDDTYSLFTELVARLKLEFDVKDESDVVMEALRRTSGFGRPDDEDSGSEVD